MVSKQEGGSPPSGVSPLNASLTQRAGKFAEKNLDFEGGEDE